MPIPLKINNTFLGSRRQITIPVVLNLSNDLVDEDAAVGTLIGELFVTGGNGPYTYTIDSDPDSKFEIVGNELFTADDLDFEEDEFHTVTVSADNGVDDPLLQEFTISVVDVEDGAIVLLANEATGLAVDFTLGPSAFNQSVAVKAPAITEYSINSFFANGSSATPKLLPGPESGVLVWSPHNQFLNSEAPVTQNVTLVVGATYTFGVVGSGSLVGSAGASGTATEGNPVTFVATTTTGTFTKSGTLTRIQINRGRLLTEYLATTAAIRVGLALDYDPVTQEPLGLLTESAMTNIAQWSRDLTNAVWTKSNITAVKDQVGAEGSTNGASKITATSANGTCLQTQTLASSTRRMSAYVKRITGTGTVEMTTDNGATWTPITVPSGSYGRVFIPAQLVTNPVFGFRIVTSGDAIAVDLVQNESSSTLSAPSSPFPAFGASSSRNTDNITALTSTFPFSATEFSVILTGSPKNITSANGNYLGFSDGTANERVSIDCDSTNRRGRLTVVDGGVTQATPNITGTPVLGQYNRIGVGVKANDFGISVDGSTPATDVAGTLPTLDRMIIGGVQGTSGGNSRIKRFIVVPRRMTNSELQTLTA